LASPFMVASLCKGARRARDAHDYTANGHTHAAVVESQPKEGRSDVACRKAGRRRGVTATQRSGMIAVLRRNGQGGGPAFGRDRDFHQLACLAFATAAAGGATGLRLHRFERIRTPRDSAAHILVGDGFADADVHGGFRRGSLDGRHLNANANDCQVASGSQERGGFLWKVRPGMAVPASTTWVDLVPRPLWRCSDHG